MWAGVYINEARLSNRSRRNAVNSSLHSGHTAQPTCVKLCEHTGGGFTTGLMIRFNCTLTQWHRCILSQQSAHSSQSCYFWFHKASNRSWAGFRSALSGKIWLSSHPDPPSLSDSFYDFNNVCVCVVTCDVIWFGMIMWKTDSSTVCVRAVFCMCCWTRVVQVMFGVWRPVQVPSPAVTMRYLCFGLQFIFHAGIHKKNKIFDAQTLCFPGDFNSSQQQLCVWMKFFSQHQHFSDCLKTLKPHERQVFSFFFEKEECKKKYVFTCILKTNFVIQQSALLVWPWKTRCYWNTTIKKSQTDSCPNLWVTSGVSLQAHSSSVHTGSCIPWGDWLNTVSLDWPGG